MIKSALYRKYIKPIVSGIRRRNKIRELDNASIRYGVILVAGGLLTKADKKAMDRNNRHWMRLIALPAISRYRKANEQRRKA